MKRSLDQEDPLKKEMQPIPVFLPGESMDRGAWQATANRVTKSPDWATEHSHTLAKRCLRSLMFRAREMQIKTTMSSSTHPPEWLKK